MADPSAFYEPEEEEMLSSLAIPNYDGDYSGEQDFQELEQHAYANHEREEEHAAALESIPQDVKRVGLLELCLSRRRRHRSRPCRRAGMVLSARRVTDNQFLVLFHQAILDNDLPAITNMYESGWQKLTQVGRFYSRRCSPRSQK
jgi:translation initiation factor 3 subunit L